MNFKHTDPDRPKKAADLGLGFGEFIPIVKRNEWGAQKPKNYARLSVPVTIVRLTFTGGFVCSGNDTCIATLRDLQKFHVDSGLSDIKHNFMIGGNGVVYEGRGFTYQPLLPKEFAQLAATCIDIALIGTYEFEEPSYDVMRLALDLIRCGIKKEVLDPNFELISLPKVKKINQKSK